MLKYHWFCAQLAPAGPCQIELLEIATTEQLGDIFTKGLGRDTFQHLRKKIMGW